MTALKLAQVMATPTGRLGRALVGTGLIGASIAVYGGAGVVLAVAERVDDAALHGVAHHAGEVGDAEERADADAEDDPGGGVREIRHEPQPRRVQAVEREVEAGGVARVRRIPARKPDDRLLVVA